MKMMEGENLWTVGAIRLNSIYVLTITGSYRGKISFRNPKLETVQCAKIFKVKDVFFTPVSNNKLNEKDTELLNGINALLKREFYFSYGSHYDIIHNLQSQILTENLDFNEEFCWNRHALNLFNTLDPSIQEQFSKNQKVHLIQGFVAFSTVNIDNRVFDYVLISRRSQNRAGPRLLKRGINTKCHVANYVETEQIIFNNDYISSYIQIRGSVPIKWRQSLTLQWDPRIEIKKDFNHHDVSKLYFDKYTKKYGRITIVNLLKISGNEKELTHMYCDIVSQSDESKIKYVHFDMHKICGQEAFSKIHLLSDMVDKVIKEDSVFIMNKDGKVISKQLGVIRTNCKDNLDRTNLTQTYLASKAFNMQILDNEKEYTFRDIDALRFSWADNGDALSLFYTGTPSLKGEQTRHGRGSLYSLWRDFRSSSLRYYLNNFEDGMYQDIINVFLGKSSMQVKETKDISTISRIISFIFILFKPGYNTTHTFFGYIRAFVWSTCVFITWKVLNLDKNAIVQYPKLVKVDKIKEE